MVLKDRHPGYIAAKLCKDKTTASAVMALRQWFYRYGFDNVLRTDGGPAFKESFTKEMDMMGVKDVLSSSYNPQSNRGAERVVKSLREFLEKRGAKKTDQLELSEICLRLTHMCSLEAEGQPMSAF